MSKNTGIAYEIVTQQIFQSLLNQTEVKNIRVEQNVKLQGKSTRHQIDVYWEYQLAGIVYRTVVQTNDCISVIPHDVGVCGHQPVCVEDHTGPNGLLS